MKLKQRLTAQQRAETLSDYVQHLMHQWQDRESDLRWSALSAQLTQNIRSLSYSADIYCSVFSFSVNR